MTGGPGSADHGHTCGLTSQTSGIPVVQKRDEGILGMNREKDTVHPLNTGRSTCRSRSFDRPLAPPCGGRQGLALPDAAGDERRDHRGAVAAVHSPAATVSPSSGQFRSRTEVAR